MSANALFFLNEEATYSGPEPYFYDKKQYPWAQTLEDNWTIIRDEMMPIISGEKAIELSSPYPPSLSEPSAWKNIYFFNFMWQYHKNCRQFPKTYALLKSIPNLTFAEFTVLEPGCQILPHIGETNTTIRGHLGISIPGKLPEAGIRVGNEERSWEEGKVVLFSDCHRHTVWNHTKNRRFVLVFDITRSEFAEQKTWVNAQSLGAITIKYLDDLMPALKKTPENLKHILHKAISFLWWVYLPLQNFWSRLYS